jgi:uncharacterized protein YoaH (UPF0181 family)
MSNKQQTAVEWLEQEMLKGNLSLKEILIQAKEMDREQKKHAYDWGETNGADECNGDGATHENFEQYYQETYGGNK